MIENGSADHSNRSRFPAGLPLGTGIVVLVLYSQANLVFSGNAAIVSISPVIKRGLLAGGVLLGIAWILGSPLVRGSLALVGGGSGLLLTVLGIYIWNTPTLPGYAVIIGTFLVFISGIIEVSRHWP